MFAGAVPFEVPSIAITYALDREALVRAIHVNLDCIMHINTHNVWTVGVRSTRRG